ncbi:hypothetical protein GGR20_001337 [Devosia subaequoris]|uniref:DUF4333 domain-containing protein n=1 Tax=Devosia subaequoris TaxID=395930 RepID=A0A7W6NBI5_9HYPH|nr:hypothetical protein [Devosia subaequoris]MBB4051701.1 hypothetical protein [Devosia subaequoris]MCP1209287.1 hypothetical protein [Devosia subaequoris]
MNSAVKIVVAVASAVIGIAAMIQIASGLFGGVQLPQCESEDAARLVKQIIDENFDVQLDQLDGVEEISFDEAAQQRHCSALIDTGAEGVFQIAYSLSWQDRDLRMVAADLKIVDQKS